MNKNEISGKAFDRRYSKCMVSDHKKAISLFKREAQKGKDEELKAWANNKIPVLEGHLAMWEEVCRNNKKEN